MRHRSQGYKLGRKTNHRKAMWRNMAISLLTHGQITTTLPKARSVQPLVEKLITLAKRGDLASRRRAIAILGDPIIVRDDTDVDVQRNKYGEVVGGPKLIKKLFEEIGPTYSERNGGYTRIIKLARHRIGDGADLCVLQLVTGEESGPQVRGQYSRRREKAHRRMDFAAKLRRGGGESKGEAKGDPVKAEVAEPANEQPAAQDAVDTGSADEASAESQDQQGDEGKQ